MKLRLLFVLFCMLGTAPTFAKIGNYNLIFVHGAESKQNDENGNTAEEMQQFAREYWGEKESLGKSWFHKLDVNTIERPTVRSHPPGIIYWPMNERIQGGVRQVVGEQFRRLNSIGYCQQGCVIVSHSMGDLVVRDALTRLRMWGIDTRNFRIISTLDFAGAGGGIDVAGYLNNALVTLLNTIHPLLTQFVFDQFVEPRLQSGLDLVPANARSIGREYTPFPRLRFVGVGVDDYFGQDGHLESLLKAALTQVTGSEGDLIVPVHSSCGTARVSSYKSCWRNLAKDGDLQSTYGPRRQSDLMYNHYPVLMAKDTGHGEVLQWNYSGHITSVRHNNDRNYSGLNVDFDVSEDVRREGHWWWRYNVRKITVDNPHRKGFSELVFDSLDN